MGSSGGTCGCPGRSKALQLSKIAGDQRFFLRPRPPFQLLFTGQSAFPRFMCFLESQMNRPPRCGKRGPTAIVVSRYARGNVVGLADIKGVVGATKDIDKPHQTTMPSSAVRFNTSPSTRPSASLGTFSLAVGRMGG